MGIDEVSRRKGQVYLTVVYDLERRVLLWVGDDRTEEAVRPFCTKEMGTRRSHTLRVICMDMWAAYANLVKQHAPQAQILFDQFHIVQHLHEAVEQVRRSEMRRRSQKEKVPFQRSRWWWLKNERLSTLVQWNTPIVRAYYLKESFQLFWLYRQPKRAGDHLEKWMRSAIRSRLEPFQRFVRMLRRHLDGILSWTAHRVSNGAVEGMNNKIKSISHRSFGFRTAENFIAAIYHCSARLPLPVERQLLFSARNPSPIEPGYALSVEILITVEATTHGLVKLMSVEHPTCNREATGSRPVTSSKTIARYGQLTTNAINPGVTTHAGVMVGKASFEAFRPHQRSL
jgi:transposase